MAHAMPCALRQPPPLRRAAALFGVVGVLGLAGAGFSLVGLVSGPAHGGEVRTLAPTPAWSSAASFGPVVVEAVERGALSLHGGRHSDPSDRSDEVRVRVRLTNRLARTVAYSPGQFRLRLAETGTTISPVDPNPPPGAIRAGTTLLQRLSFIVPARRTALVLVFDDIGAATPVSIGLGSLRGPAPHPDGSAAKGTVR